MAAAPSSALAWEKPWFCHELDCPQYEVVENLTSIGVELRRYAPSQWVETTIENATNPTGAVPGVLAPAVPGGGGFGGPGSASAMMGGGDANGGTGYERAVAMGFYKLFKYISGENLTGQKLEMTAPVRVVVTPGTGPACADKFSIAFFIPPPASDPTVSIVTTPESTYYSHGFSGWATGATYADRARSVAAALEGAGREIDDSYFGTAGYDSPFRLRNRHNEVWLPAVLDGKKAASGGTKKVAGAAAAPVKPAAAAAASKPAAAAAAVAAKPAVAAAAKGPVAKPAAALKLPTANN